MTSWKLGSCTLYSFFASSLLSKLRLSVTGELVCRRAGVVCDVPESIHKHIIFNITARAAAWSRTKLGSSQIAGWLFGKEEKRERDRKKIVIHRIEQAGFSPEQQSEGCSYYSERRPSMWTPSGGL